MKEEFELRMKAKKWLLKNLKAYNYKIKWNNYILQYSMSLGKEFDMFCTLPSDIEQLSSFIDIRLSKRFSNKTHEL